MKRILLLCMMMGVWSFQAQDDTDNCPIVGNENQSFCESQGTGNDYYRPAVQHLEVTANGSEVVWYDSNGEPLPMTDLLVDGEVYYAGTTSGPCGESASVSVTLNDSPSAGATTFHTVALDGEPFDLVNVFQHSILGPAEAGGTVSPALASGTTEFDPAVDRGGQYRYTVASSSLCPDDSAFIYITVEPEGELPPDDDVPGDDEPSTNCPTVEFTEQVFCESQGTGNDFYQPAIAHLTATANGDDIVWYDSVTSTEALASDEILATGDYYAGNASGSCTERVRVDVVVNASPSAGSTTFVTICSDAGTVDLLDYLNPSMIGEADPGGTVVPPLNSGTTTFDPALDTAGQYEYHVESPNEFCPDDKAVIYVTVSDFATIGDDISIQVFEDGGPVDLSTQLNASPDADITWSPSFASGTNVFDPAEDSAGVYTASVANGEGCGDDSAQVTIILVPSDVVPNCPIVEEPVQTFCQSEGTGNDYYRPAVAHLSAVANGEDIAWFADELDAEPLSPDELLVDGATYYAGNVSGNCAERAPVVVDLLDSPNAGATTSITVNSTDASFNLLDVMEESILGPADAGGTFSPALASGTTVFDPSVDVGGQYTYTVTSTTSCPDDLAVIYITVNDMGEVSAVSPDADSNVAMYPNPSRGDLNLSVTEGVKAMSLRIFDLNGNTVKSMKLDSEVDLQNLDISSLKPSIYFAEIVTDKGKVVKRILKN